MYLETAEAYTMRQSNERKKEHATTGSQPEAVSCQ
jgi:hypothetical protein